MNKLRPCALWIDHQRARILRLTGGEIRETTLVAPHAHGHHHAKGSSEEHHDPTRMHHFFHDVMTAVSDSDALLVMGPSTAKTQFIHYLEEHRRGMNVAVESTDHPTDGQLMQLARAHFDAARGVVASLR